MQSSVRAVLIVSLLVGFGSSIPLAHHSVSGEFDLTKTATLKGVISRLDWINPHIYVYLDVSEADGATTTYLLETFPPPQMRRVGLTKELIMGKPGEVVTITILPPKDGTKHIGYIERITYQDGHFNQLGSNEEEQLRRRGGQPPPAAPAPQ
jgi:Family of unknown function (DUF6152)